jgi:hypothetical protein
MSRSAKRPRPGRGRSAIGLAAGQEAGRGGSRRWTRVVAGRRSKPAGCALPWKSTISSRPSACRRPSAGARDGVAALPRLPTRRHSASSAPGPWRHRWICAARGWRRRSRRSIATWTMPVSPDSGRRRSSTGSARARCAMPFGRLPRHTHWSVPSGPVSAERAATGRRSSRSSSARFAHPRERQGFGGLLLSGLGGAVGGMHISGGSSGSQLGGGGATGASGQWPVGANGAPQVLPNGVNAPS